MTQTELTIPPPPMPAKPRAAISQVIVCQSTMKATTKEIRNDYTRAAPQSKEPMPKMVMLVHKTF
jgi:hypothetical protein